MTKKRPPESGQLFEDHGADRPRSRTSPSGLPKGLSSDKYEMDEDGRPRELVGAWSRDKHARLERYIQISAAARRKWLRTSGATYIDLFAGPGRCRIRETAEIIDGSPVTAWKKALSRTSAFSHVVVADANASICTAVDERLAAAGAPVAAIHGTAAETVDKAIAAVPARALHLAFLDPFDLGSLPFEIIGKLATLDHIDILIHVSISDLTRNLRRYIKAEHSALDVFAPRWREAVDVESPDPHVRSQLFRHWRGLLGTVGMKTSEAAELVSGPSEQPLYWLAFVARHPLALKFWEQVRNLGGQRDHLQAT